MSKMSETTERVKTSIYLSKGCKTFLKKKRVNLSRFIEMKVYQLMKKCDRCGRIMTPYEEDNNE